MRLSLFCGLIFLASSVHADESASLAESLLFHASFDESGDANVAQGDPHIYTAATLKRDAVKPGLHSDAVTLDPGKGRFGGALTFAAKSEQVVFFKGAENLPSTKKNFCGTFSCWLRTSLSDLPPGYVDPLQITDKKWNDASFFVDFTKETPRAFRLGVFSDHTFWNPQNRKWDNIKDDERPLVTVRQPPFSSQAWTHVAITFDAFNAGQKNSQATLYLNGQRQGDVKRPQQITWKHPKLAIMLGIYYVGQLDDLAVFDRALTAAEVKRLFQLPAGIKSLNAGG